MMYMAVDPGETIGWAVFNADGNLTIMGQDKKEKFYLILDQYSTVKVYIVEDYRVFKHVDHSGSKVETTRIIGAIDHHANTVGARIVMQSTDNREIGYKWGHKYGLRKAKSHAQSHQLDAIAHGYYYLVKNGVL